MSVDNRLEIAISALEEISKQGPEPPEGLEAEFWTWCNADDVYRYGQDVGAFDAAEMARDALKEIQQVK